MTKPSDLDASRALVLGADRWARSAEIVRLAALDPTPDAAVALIAALLRVPRDAPPGSDAALVWEAGQTDAARALCRLVPRRPDALAPLVRRIARADTAAAVALDGLAIQAEAGWQPPQGVAEICAAALRVPDRPRARGWGGDGPLRPLWQSAVRLLAHCPELPQHRSTLLALLSVPEVAFEPDPMYRGMRPVHLAALRAMECLGPLTDTERDTLVKLLDGRFDGRPHPGSTAPALDHFVRAHAVAPLLRGTAADALPLDALRQWMDAVVAGDMAPMLVVALPALVSLPAAIRAALLHPATEMSSAWGPLLAALADDAPPFPALRARIHGLADAPRLADRREFFDHGPKLIARGDLVALDRLLLRVADRSASLRAATAKQLEALSRDAPGVVVHRREDIVKALTTLTADADTAVVRAARKALRAVDRLRASPATLPAWAQQTPDAPAVPPTPAKPPLPVPAEPPPAPPSPAAAQKLVKTLEDRSASPRARLDALHALSTASLDAPAIHALGAVLLDADDPAAEALTHPLVVALTARAPEHSEAASVLLDRAARLDYAGIAAADALATLVRKGCAPPTASLVAWARAVLDRAAPPVEARGRWDLLQRAARQLLGALGLDADDTAKPSRR